MWDRITQALAELGPAALALAEGQEDMDVAAASPEELVEYEGMLISASAAQRRRHDGCRQLCLTARYVHHWKNAPLCRPCES